MWSFSLNLRWNKNNNFYVGGWTGHQVGHRQKPISSTSGQKPFSTSFEGNSPVTIFHRKRKTCASQGVTPTRHQIFMIFGIIQKTIENDAVWSPDVGNGKIWAFEPITSIKLAVEVHGATSSLEDVAPEPFTADFSQTAGAMKHPIPPNDKATWVLTSNHNE